MTPFFRFLTSLDEIAEAFTKVSLILAFLLSLAFAIYFFLRFFYIVIPFCFLVSFLCRFGKLIQSSR